MSLRAGVVVFPGSNCDRDIAVALGRAGADVAMIWHKGNGTPGRARRRRGPRRLLLRRLPALRRNCRPFPDHALGSRFRGWGGHVLGVCNGFQVLVEAGLLPGALMRNARLRFICAAVPLEVATEGSVFTAGYAKGEMITLPIAHHDGNYRADFETLARLRGEDRIAFRYASNPNGSADDIAGILSANRRVLGMMPHPERAVDRGHGGTDGAALFASLARTLAEGRLQDA